MNSLPLLRDVIQGLFGFWLVFMVSSANAERDTIKIGILHSLSGTMAISESVLKDTVLMLIADQNKKGGYWDGRWSRLSLIPDVIAAHLQSINSVRAEPWSRYLPDSVKRTADWTFPWVCGGCIEPTFKDW